MEAKPEDQCYSKQFPTYDSFLSRGSRGIALGPAQTNLGRPMRNDIRPISAGAHWQLGKTESHGGWFARVPDKLIDSY